MSLDLAVYLLIALALVAANLPFLSQRLLLLGPRRDDKGLGWRLLELLILCALVTALGFLLEARLGQRHAQGWPFYAVVFCLFLTFAFPGFVWRHLRRST